MIASTPAAGPRDLPAVTRYRWKEHSVLPGFGLSLSVSIAMLSLIVLIPLAGLAIKTLELTWAEFWATVTDPRSLAAFKLSFGAALLAALVNVPFGILVAWVLERYRFPGRKLVDGLIDLPFALPTAVAGIALTAIYAPNGPIGSWLQGEFGVKAAYSQLGIVIALIFIGFPFIVRTVQPVVANFEKEVEEAAASLGATRGQTFLKVLLPTLWPAALTGVALAFARGVGEYGSVVFISGNMPMRTEIVPLLIVTKLEQYQYAGATAIALVMLLLSFVLLFLINLLQGWVLRRSR